MRNKITDEQLADAVAQCTSMQGVLRYFGLRMAGGTHAHYKNRINRIGLDTSHWLGRGSNKGKIFSTLRKSSADILVELPIGSNRPKVYQLIRAMLQSGLTYVCRCGNIGEWQGQSLTLEVDHIDGNWLNNKIENLRFLCPNCHSQEGTTNKPNKYAYVA